MILVMTCLHHDYKMAMEMVPIATNKHPSAIPASTDPLPLHFSSSSVTDTVPPLMFCY